MRNTHLIQLLSLGLAFTTVACGDDSDSTAVETDSTAETPDGETPDGETPATPATPGGETPDGETPDGETPDGETPDGETPDGETPDGETPNGCADPAASCARVVHLGVGVEGVDVYAGGNLIAPLTNLGFRTATAYAGFPPNTYDFAVTATGATIEEAPLTFSAELAAGTTYTVAAIGNGSGEPALQELLIVDDTSEIAAGNFRLTVVHAAPAVETVDIFLMTDGQPGEEPLIDDLAFGDVRPLNDLAIGALSLGIDADGTDNAVNIAGTFEITEEVAASLDGLNVNAFANNDDAGAPALVAVLPTGDVAALPLTPAP